VPQTAELGVPVSNKPAPENYSHVWATQIIIACWPVACIIIDLAMSFLDYQEASRFTL